MRVSLVTETYFPQVNGVSRTLDRLVHFLVGSGDELQILAPRYPEGAPSVPEGVTVVSFRGVALPFYREVRLPLTTSACVARWFEAFRPDVVHVATEGTLGRAALSAARRLRIPLVSSYHTNFPQYLRSYRLGFLEGVAWRYLIGFHNATAATLCPTKSVRAALESKGIRPAVVWSRGVDAALFHPARRSTALREFLGCGPEDVVIAYVGRLAAEKNLDMLLRACRGLPSRGTWRLLVVGDGPLRSKLEGLEDSRILLTGYKRGEPLAELYASADLFAFPSLTDTFGNVILEAMASGLPVVAFEVDGPRDVILDGVTGSLVRTVSAAALASALCGLIEEPSRRRELGGSARTYAESQRWDQVNAVVRQRYATAIEEARVPQGATVGGAAPAREGRQRWA